MKMTPEQKVAAMNAAKQERLKHPVECKDCHEEFLRKSLVAKRCDSCKDKHRREKAPQRAAQSRKAKKNLGAPPTVPTNPTNPPAGSDEELTLLCTCGHPMGRHEFGCLEVSCKCEEFTMAAAPEARRPPVIPQSEIRNPQSDKPIANESCKTCGNCYFPGVTGIDGECTKCLGKRLEKAALGYALGNACPAVSGRAPRGMILVPVKALEQAHGTIQKLWAEIARLTAAKGA